MGLLSRHVQLVPYENENTTSTGISVINFWQNLITSTVYSYIALLLAIVVSHGFWILSESFLTPINFIFFFLCLINTSLLGFWNPFKCFTSSVPWGFTFLSPFLKKVLKNVFCSVLGFLPVCETYSLPGCLQWTVKEVSAVSEKGNVLIHSIRGERKAFQTSEGRQYVQWFEGGLLGKIFVQTAVYKLETFFLR